MIARFFRPFLPLILLLGLLPTILSGCAGATIDESDPAALYQDAEEEIKSDHYQLALDKLKAIKNKFPYAKQAVDAQLRIADVLYLQESFAEAAAAYESFRDLHPKHEKVGYAMFRTGKSYFNDMPGAVSRDMTSAQKALDSYNEFLQRFPKAPEAPEAQNDVALIRKGLAEKELYIGDFYLKRDFPDSARPRYEKVVAMFPETDAARQAREKLERIAKRSGPPKEKAKEQE
jgi:outer membrane protein assembly factor BamD